jgi:hypothetical protein
VDTEARRLLIEPVAQDGRSSFTHRGEFRHIYRLDCLVWKFHNNLHLSEKELALVEIGAGELHTEYVKVVNSAMRSQDCVAHVSGKGWGRTDLRLVTFSCVFI